MQFNKDELMLIEFCLKLTLDSYKKYTDTNKDVKLDNNTLQYIDDINKLYVKLNK